MQSPLGAPFVDQPLAKIGESDLDPLPVLDIEPSQRRLDLKRRGANLPKGVSHAPPRKNHPVAEAIACLGEECVDCFRSHAFVGLVAGWLAGQIVQGTGFGLVADIAIGIVGALIGSWLLPALGIHLGAGIVPAIIGATLGAVLLLLIFRLVYREADGSCGLIAQEEGPSASAGALTSGGRVAAVPQ